MLVKVAPRRTTATSTIRNAASTLLVRPSGSTTFETAPVGPCKSIRSTRCYKVEASEADVNLSSWQNEGEEELMARDKLAACYKIAVKNGWEEGVCNHFTYALGDSADKFLVIPFGLHWSEVEPQSLLLVDSHTGKAVKEDQSLKEKDFTDNEPSATAFFLHSRIHLRRPKTAKCVLHTHSPYATALNLLKDSRLKMVHQNSMRYQKTIRYDEEYNGLILSNEEGDRIADVLGDEGRVLMMRNHGVMVAHDSIEQAYNSLYYLERAAMHQVLAMSTGKEMRLIDDNILADSARYYPGELEEYYAVRHFNAARRGYNV